MREYLLVWLLLVGWVFKGGGVFIGEGAVCVVIRLIAIVFREESLLKRGQKGDWIKWQWAGQCEVEVTIICFVDVVASNHCFL